MENSKYANLDEAVNSMATKLAFKKLKLEKGIRELNDNQEKLQILYLEVKKNEEDVKKNIDAICNTVVKENPNILITKEFKLDVANYMSQQIESKGLTSASQINVSSAFAKEVLEKSNSYSVKQEQTNDITKNSVLEYIITQQSLKNFEENMKTEYGHQYFSSEDFENVVKVNEELTSTIGKENLDSMIEQSNNGGEEVSYKLMIVQNAQIKIAEYADMEKIPEDRIEDYLMTTMLLSEISDSPEIKALYEKMAEKLPEEVFSISENGVKMLDAEKMRALYQKIYPGKDIDKTLLFHKEGYETAAKEYVTNPEMKFNNAEDFTIENTIEGQQRMLQRNFNTIVELQNSQKSQEEIAHAMADLENKSKKYLDASLRLAESMAQTETFPEDKKVFTILRDSVLDGLIEAKSGTDFVDDEYTKESKKNLFRAIIQKGIEEKQPIDESLLSKIAMADINIAKEVLKEFIDKQNENSNVVLEQYIQVFGKKIKTVSETEKDKNSEERKPSTRSDSLPKKSIEEPDDELEL